MIRNKTKNTLVVKSFSKEVGLKKFVGLIGSKNPNAIIFNTRFGIHTFLLKFSIDVLILDKNNKVVSMRNNLKPNKIFLWNIANDIVIELPSGSIQKSKTQIGDFIEYDL